VIVLDTTILGYAVGSDHPLRAPCRRLVAAHADGIVDGATTVEVIQEFTHIQARRRQRVDAVSLAQAYAVSLRLLLTNAEDLDLGLHLFERHPRLGAFDAMLAAVALNQGAEALVSADAGFDAIPGLRWIDPGTQALEALLR
jgi:predicted nucleic acid-binding protein